MFFSKIIDSNMLWVPRREIDDLDAVKKRLTARSRFNKDVEVSMYQEKGKWFGFPRHYFVDSRELTNNFVDKRADGAEFSFHIKSDFRKGQKEAINSIMFKINYDKGTGFLLDIPTGGGKTFVVLNVLSQLKRTALIVVYKSDLIEHWLKEIKLHTDIKRSDVGIAEDGKTDWQNKKILIGLVHTLGKDRNTPDFKKRWGVVVFDEADRSVPPRTFSKIAGMFPARYRIGVSATLKRRDGLHAIFKQHMGQFRIVQQSVDKMDSRVLVLRLKWFAGNIPMHLPVMVRRGILFKKMERNYERNQKIVRQIFRYLKANRRVIVAAARTALLSDVRDLLIKAGLQKEKVGYYTRSVTKIITVAKGKKIVKNREKRGVKKPERVETAAACDVLLATYKMIEAGTNLPDVSGLILATPQVSATQILGRIERTFEGKKFPVVTDLVDVNYEDCVRWGLERQKEYKERGLRIKIKEEKNA